MCVYLQVILPYSVLRKANVQGTNQIIKLAQLSKGNAALHYVSTLSVFDNSIESLTEDTPLTSTNSDIALMGGYSASKWVAEKQVEFAKLRGLPVTIYRPGSIAGIL